MKSKSVRFVFLFDAPIEQSIVFAINGQLPISVLSYNLGLLRVRSTSRPMTGTGRQLIPSSDYFVFCKSGRFLSGVTLVSVTLVMSNCPSLLVRVIETPVTRSCTSHLAGYFRSHPEKDLGEDAGYTSHFVC